MAVAWLSLLPARVLRSVSCPQYTHTLLRWSAVLHGGAASPFPDKGISPLSSYLTKVNEMETCLYYLSMLLFEKSNQIKKPYVANRQILYEADNMKLEIFLNL